MEKTNDNHAKNLPRDLFIHLLAIAALYGSVVSMLTLFFQYINVAFPDTLDFYYTGATDSIRWAAAALIVLFPVYFFLMWMLERDSARHPEKREFKVRKWLVYFTLFISAITIIVDLITLLYNFLGGELTIHFALKIISVLAVAVAVFGFYLWDLRRIIKDKSSVLTLIAWSLSAIVVIAIAAGFFVVGTPAYQRARRFDEQRIQHLQNIQNEVINYWQRTNALPEQLNDLRSGGYGFSALVDPETGESYTYRRTGDLSYQLCALFQTSGDPKVFPNTKVMPAYSYGREAYVNLDWSHGIGNICFTRVIDPQYYKGDVQSKMPPIPRAL